MKNKTGFTLIELLVVVLIIGILAAVALPQYQKAVLKSRLVNWTAVLDAIKKNIEVYHLEKGGGAEFVAFSGTDGEENNTMKLPCDSSTDRICTINRPAVNIEAFWRGTASNDELYSVLFAVKPNDFPELTGDAGILFAKDSKSGKWSVDIIKRNMPRILCEWIQGLGYPGKETIVSQCGELGVTITPYTE